MENYILSPMFYRKLLFTSDFNLKLALIEKWLENFVPEYQTFISVIGLSLYLLNLLHGSATTNCISLVKDTTPNQYQ